MSDNPPRDPQGRDEFTERRPRRSTGDGRRRASDAESDMRRQYERDKEDANRKSISNVRHEASLLRQELRADIEKVSDASRERDKELHVKFDTRNEKFDERLDKLKADILELRGDLKGVATRQEEWEKQSKDEWADVPWYARPSYIKAMGLALAAVLSALIVSLGVVFGWGGSDRAPHTPSHGDHAPADPGAAPEGD